MAGNDLDSSVFNGGAKDSSAPSVDRLTVRIYSAEHWAYWRPRGKGYTTIAEDAGLWTLREARHQTRHCGPEKRIMFEPLSPQPGCVELGDTSNTEMSFDKSNSSEGSRTTEEET